MEQKGGLTAAGVALLRRGAKSHQSVLYLRLLVRAADVLRRLTRCQMPPRKPEERRRGKKKKKKATRERLSGTFCPFLKARRVTFKGNDGQEMEEKNANMCFFLGLWLLLGESH